MFEGLAEERLNYAWDLQVGEDQRTCFQCSLQWRDKDDVWLEILMLFPSLNALCYGMMYLLPSLSGEMTIYVSGVVDDSLEEDWILHE